MLPWMPWSFLRVSTYGYSDLKRLRLGIPILFTERKWIHDTISISKSVMEWHHQSIMDRELAGSPCCWRQQARRCWYHRWKQKVHGLARFNKLTKMGAGVFCCILGQSPWGMCLVWQSVLLGNVWNWFLFCYGMNSWFWGWGGGGAGSFKNKKHLNINILA